MAVQLCLFVVLILLEMTRAGPEMCQNGYKNNGTTIRFDTTCSKNCSQEPPRIDGDTQFFNCSIGGQQEVMKYRQTHSEYFEVSSQTFSVSKIKEVELYYKCFDNGCFRTELALKFNFFLPPGIKGDEVSDSIMPKAVLLRFESIQDKSVQDEYYYTCPRERIFQFHNYFLVNAYDLYNLRELSYDCLVGLQTKHKVVYNITLQTAQGKSASYITTIIPRQPYFRAKIIPWQPVIMTHLNVTDHSLFVVIEKAPPMYNVRTYIIHLVREPDMVVRSSNNIEFKDKQYVNFTTFRNISSGRYHIKVIPRCPKACTTNTTSYHIVYVGDDVEYPHYLEVSIDAMQVVAMVAGCVVGVVLVLLAVVFLLRVRKNHERYSGVNPNGYIIHPHATDSREYETVTNLKRFITENCECTIKDYQEMDSDLAESREELIKNSLRESSFVVVIYSHSHHADRKENNSRLDFYSFVLNTTFEQRKRSNNLRIIEIRFPTNSSNGCPTILTKHRKFVKTVNFCTEPAQLYCNIHGTKKPPANNANEALKSSTLWRHIMAQFQLNIADTKGTQESEIEPLLPPDKQNNQHERMVSDQTSPKVKKPVSDIFEKMAKMNQDTDDEEEDRVRFNLTECRTKSALSEPFKPISNARSVGHSDNENKTGGCSIRFEADVHADPVNNQRVIFKNTANNGITISESLSRACYDSVNPDKAKKFVSICVTGNEHVNNNQRISNEQHFHSVPDTCYHKTRTNERTDICQPKRVMRNENNHKMNMVHVPNVESAKRMIQRLNTSDSSMDSDHLEQHVPYLSHGHNDVPCRSDYQVQQHHLQHHHPRSHNQQHHPQHHHPHHQQHHALVYDDNIAYDNMQFESNHERANHMRISRDYGPNINTNQECSHSLPENRYFDDKIQHTERYNGQQQTHEIYFNDFPTRDTVPYQQHPNNFDLTDHRSHLHRYGAGVMTHGNFHPQPDPHFMLNHTEEGCGRFNAVDPPTDRIHETSVKQRPEAPSVTRSSSSKSLPPDMWHAPSDLDSAPPVNDAYHRFDPIPPDEEEGQQSLNASSDLIDQLIEINQIGRTT